MDCVRCDRFEMPDDFKAYRKTAEFNERTVPQSLRRDHSTKPGVWAKIQVIEGKLNYRIGALSTKFELSPEVPRNRHSRGPAPCRTGRLGAILRRALAKGRQ